MKAKTIIKKIFKGILRYVLPLFMLLIMGIGLFSIVSSKINGNQLPMPFGYGIGVVLSNSMKPELQVDDLIVVNASGDYEVGDIIVFQNGKSLTVHRIVDIQTMKYKEYEENYLGNEISDPIIGSDGKRPNDPENDVVVYTTKGDANNANDKPILESKIQGEVIKVVPGGRAIVDILQSPIVTILAGVLAIFLMQASFKKQKKEDSAELEALEAEIRKLSGEIESENAPDEETVREDSSDVVEENGVSDESKDNESLETKENADSETKVEEKI